MSRENDDEQQARSIDERECYGVGIHIGTAQWSIGEALMLAYRGSHHRLRPSTRQAIEAAQKALDNAQQAVNRELDQSRKDG